MNQIAIQTQMSQIRDMVNERWMLNTLLKDRKKWLQICACMDTIEDTQAAIECYNNLPNFTKETDGYLYLYGLLQALFMQQDAISHLHNAIIGIRIEWGKDHLNIYNIRELRNDAVGHPTNRDNGKSFHCISRNSISNFSFDILSHTTQNNSVCPSKPINVIEVIEEQYSTITKLLYGILTELHDKLHAHKMKFADDKMIGKMPENWNYHLSKIGEGIHADYPNVQSQVNTLTTAIEDIKTAIVQRYGKEEQIDCIDAIDHILQRFNKWINDNELYENKDADVFLIALKFSSKELEEVLIEIDERFLTPNTVK